MDEAVSIELLKLLLQVAWADDELSGDEVESLHHHAAALYLSPPAVAEFDAWLHRRAPLPPPNMGLLREHRAVALRACARLTQSDGVVRPEEHALMRQVMEMLGPG
jgi:tellurite resistance protein